MWTFGSGMNLIIVSLLILLFLLLGWHSPKKPLIGMSFGSIVLQVNTHRLIESDFWCGVMLSRCRPWQTPSTAASPGCLLACNINGSRYALQFMIPSPSTFVPVVNCCCLRAALVKLRLSWVKQHGTSWTHLTAAGSQCYLPPDTSVHTLPNHTPRGIEGRVVLDGWVHTEVIYMVSRQVLTWSPSVNQLCLVINDQLWSVINY